jgi:hypothetical protein
VVVAAGLFLALAAATGLVLARNAPAGAARQGQALLVVQATSAALLLVDGVPRAQLLAGEPWTIVVSPGPHRVELQTPDGRRARATVQAREGETAELLAVELE